MLNSAEPAGRRRLSYRSLWLQVIRIAGVVAGIVAAFQLPDPEALARSAPLLTIVGVTAVTSMVAARIFLAAERRHDRALEADWERTARERAWQFDRDSVPVQQELLDLLVGREHKSRTEGSPYRLTGAHRGRAMTAQIWLVRGPRMLLWKELPERRTVIVTEATVPLPVVGFGTGGWGMRLIERGSQVLKGARFGTHRSGHWVAAGEPDVMPVAMEVFDPFLTDMIKPLRIVRVVAAGDRVGLMINQEKDTTEIFAWLDTMDRIATTLEDAVRDGTLPAGPEPTASTDAAQP